MKSQRVILTGEIGAGKTTFCSHIANMGRRDGLRVRGVISPGVFEEGQKVGITAVNLKNDQARPLAYLRKEETTGPKTKRWAFVEETIQWGNQVLARAAPCDMLVVDELGPIEFERGEGWVQGLRVIDGGAFQAAIIVIRPHLLDQASARWPTASRVELTPDVDLLGLAKKVYQRLACS